MNIELMGILKTGMDFENFKKIYFDHPIDNRTANEFYSDFVNSGLNINRYIEETTEYTE